MTNRSTPITIDKTAAPPAPDRTAPEIVVAEAPLEPGRPASSVSDRITRAIAGTLLARPWFDHATLYALRTIFFPTSRLFAAAREAGGDIERFYAAIPQSPKPRHRERVRRALALFEERRAAVNAIETEWRSVFFGVTDQRASYCAATEAARRSLRHAYNASRGDFRFLVDRETPRVKLAISTPDETAAIYGPALADLAPFVAAPATQPHIEVSRLFDCPTSRDGWLRFRSPSPRLADTVYARIHEPLGIVDPPTVIFGHGVCVEFDHWKGLMDECAALIALGFRVVRPEAAWHGRRVAPGRFGGEQVIGAFPTGTLDALTGAVQEWAVISRWARETSRGPIVFAGSSLGAMTSQLAASCARDWPRSIQPDAMLLLTHTGDMAAAVTDGALSTMFADRSLAEAKGWTDQIARRYFSLLNPARPPVMPPAQIVSVLGSRDVVLPYDSGHRLVERWNVPPENVFVWDRGHFSVPMTLIRNDAPLQRLRRIVDDL